MNTNVRTIYGNWDAGFVLDRHVLHSHVVGENEWGYPRFETTRTELGEAMYQLKYNADFTQVGAVAQELANTLFPRLDKVGLIVPMPASNPRPAQPVTVLAEALGRLVSVPVFDGMLTKTPNGQQLKNMERKEDKVNALAGTFTLHEDITNEGRWNALILDDLFHTGASLEAACAALRKYTKIGRIYVAAVTWRRQK